jgi:exodeoxyribonuclease V gamma subunit
LRRAYPDFDTLSTSGEFALLAETLLKPLIDAVKKNAGADE